MTAKRPARVRGLYFDAFWEFVDRGELRLQCCGNCASYRYPAAPVCQECGSEAFDWSAVSGRGRLVSWTRFHKQYFPDILVPYVCAVVQIEEGPLLAADVVGCDRDPLIGEPMRIAFVAAEFPTGAGQLFQWSLD